MEISALVCFNNYLKRENSFPELGLEPRFSCILWKCDTLSGQSQGSGFNSFLVLVPVYLDWQLLPSVSMQITWIQLTHGPHFSFSINKDIIDKPSWNVLFSCVSNAQTSTMKNTTSENWSNWLKNMSPVGMINLIVKERKTEVTLLANL